MKERARERKSDRGKKGRQIECVYERKSETE